MAMEERNADSLDANGAGAGVPMPCGGIEAADGTSGAFVSITLF